MKKVVNGKKYNTVTAERLGKWCNGEQGPCYERFNYLEESLYRTKKGKFFLHGEGGACTKYSRSHDGGSIWGEDITPLSDNDAIAWVEKHLSGDDFERIFGEVEEA